MLFLGACGDTSTSRNDTNDTIDPVPDVGGDIVEDTGHDASDDAGDVALDGADDAEPDPVARRVLFIGNSYTFYNDLPAVVDSLAEATPGVILDVESITRAGATLSEHYSNPDVQDQIASGQWDTLVLQGQSFEPIVGEFYPAAEAFALLLEDAGMRGVWFATWAREEGHPMFDDFGLDGPDDMTARLETGYAWASKRNEGDALARVGAAWRIAQREYPDISLFTSDGSHPNEAGTLLSACVLLQAIAGRTPRIPDPTPFGLDATQAASLCAIAGRVRCLDEETLCDGVCVDLSVNTNHCGTCSNVCRDGEPCNAGKCGCPGELTYCPEQGCFDVQSDANHCGACGVVCDLDQRCEDQTCVCPKTQTFFVSSAELSPFDPACSTADAFGTLACNRAAHLFCSERGCFNTGLAPTAGHAPRPDQTACLAGDLDVLSVEDLQEYVSTCDPSSASVRGDCIVAIHRHCIARGAVSGFGPLSVENDSVGVACLSDATKISTSFEDLFSHVSRCDTSDLGNFASTCGSAAWNLCVDRGYRAGFGPVELDEGGGVEIVCVGTL